MSLQEKLEKLAGELEAAVRANEESGGELYLSPGALADYAAALRQLAAEVGGVEGAMEEAINSLDRHLGDTDPIGDWTDEEIADEMPDLWACMVLSKARAALPKEPTP